MRKININGYELGIRLEKPKDYRKVEEVTREAFWGQFQPYCDEHLLAHRLRKSEDFVPELDFVAELDGEIIGSILYSRAHIERADGTMVEVLNFGPLSVLPEYKGRGVGSALMRHSIEEAKRLAYRAIVFFGHPDYYPRFGFERAAKYGLTTEDGKCFDAFMAMPLYDKALDGVAGHYHDSPVFRVEEADAKAFDRTFAPKEERVMATADALLERLPERAARSLREKKVTRIADIAHYHSCREIMGMEGIGPEELAKINEALRTEGYAEKRDTGY